MNPRPLPPQGSALPPEPHPDFALRNVDIIAPKQFFVNRKLQKNAKKVKMVVAAKISGDRCDFFS